MPNTDKKIPDAKGPFSDDATPEQIEAFQKARREAAQETLNEVERIGDADDEEAV